MIPTKIQLYLNGVGRNEDLNKEDIVEGIRALGGLFEKATPHQVTKWVSAYCKEMGFTFNPTANPPGGRLRKKSGEYFRLGTASQAPAQALQERVVPAGHYILRYVVDMEGNKTHFIQDADGYRELTEIDYLDLWNQADIDDRIRARDEFLTITYPAQSHG